jgi:hypothetical protein
MDLYDTSEVAASCLQACRYRCAGLRLEDRARASLSKASRPCTSILKENAQNVGPWITDGSLKAATRRAGSRRCMCVMMAYAYYVAYLNQIALCIQLNCVVFIPNAIRLPISRYVVSFPMRNCTGMFSANASRRSHARVTSLDFSSLAWFSST